MQTDPHATARLWSSEDTDDGTIHALGNGQLCAYAQGPNLAQVFGPPYSAPSLYQLTLAMPERTTASGHRTPGTAIWTHQLRIAGTPAGEIIDFVDADLPCLVRHLRLTDPLRFRLTLTVPAQVVDNGARLAGADGSLLLQAPAGLPFYHTYPFPGPIFHQIAWRGPTRAIVDRDRHTIDLICEPGESWLFLVGGSAYPEAITGAETALHTPPDALLARTQAWWQTFTRSRRDWEDILPEDLPQRARLLRTCDDVAVLIRAQQAREGGVLAGYPYHMGYVRDQYGTSRGLLALGQIAQAREILQFYWGVWQRHGRIHNAQAFGVDGAFHVHENDAVEITGYLIRQAFDLAAVGGDEEILDTVFPMLEWAWDAQVPHLVDDMLPFNGDETYVAGGILPRTTLNDGSAEATLLFCDGGARLLDWIAQHRRWPDERLADAYRTLHHVQDSYRRNFWRDGQLITNNPQRAASAALPRFRHGVCERCIAEGRFRGIEWTEHTETGRYVCPTCLALGSFPAAPPTVYALQSVSLTPLYFHTGLLPPEDLRPQINALVARYQKTGQLPSRQDQDADGTKVGRTDSAVGYDYGLLLYALTELRHPFAAAFYETTLTLADPVGAWAEYYINGRPAGTRCRPWESAISLEALLHWSAPSV